MWFFYCKYQQKYQNEDVPEKLLSYCGNNFFKLTLFTFNIKNYKFIRYYEKMILYWNEGFNASSHLHRIIHFHHTPYEWLSAVDFCTIVNLSILALLLHFCMYVVLVLVLAYLLAVFLIKISLPLIIHPTLLQISNSFIHL